MRSTVTFSLAALLALPAMSCAQAPRTLSEQRQARAERSVDPHRIAAAPQRPGEPDAASSRLESVTWNSVRHELTWVISKGQKQDGASFQAHGANSYLINMDDATMKVGGETRRFSREEAANVHVLMDLVAKYAVDSTVWWDDGQGEPVDGNGKRPPEKRRAPEPENQGKVLHVAHRSPMPDAGVASPALRTEIRLLEQRLAELKQQEKLMNGGRVQLTSYTADRY